MLHPKLNYFFKISLVLSLWKEYTKFKYKTRSFQPK